MKAIHNSLGKRYIRYKTRTILNIGPQQQRAENEERKKNIIEIATTQKVAFALEHFENELKKLYTKKHIQIA